jgi:hypothetical protein
LSADTLWCPCFLGDARSQGHVTAHNREHWSPGSPSPLDREWSTRRRQTSQVPESTLYPHAPLADPGWLDDTTVTECLRVRPSACLHRVGFLQLYNFSGFYDATCVRVPPVLHGAPRGLPRRICYRPADGLWPGGTCTHWLSITHFTRATLAPDSKVSVIHFVLAHASQCSANIHIYNT